MCEKCDSVFLRYFNDSEMLEVLDFLMNGGSLEYSFKKIYNNLEYKMYYIVEIVERMEKINFVLVSNATVKLNKSNKVIQHLIKINNILNKEQQHG